MADLEKLEDELKEAKQKILKIETYFKVGLVVAVIFGIAGSVGATIISDVNTQIQKPKSDTETVISKLDVAEKAAIKNINNTGTSVLTKITNYAEAAVDKAFSNGFDANLSVANNKWGNSNQVGYGNAPHKHTSKSVSCTNGSYVSGIKVEYSGTCRGQCDADGGVIRNIVLTCSEL